MNRRRILSMCMAFTAVEWASMPIQRPFHTCVTARVMPLMWTLRRRFVYFTPIESAKIAYYTPTPRLQFLTGVNCIIGKANLLFTITVQMKEKVKT